MKRFIANNPGIVKVCTRCILPETFPGISFNSAGLCNFCEKSNGTLQKMAEEKKEYKRKFHDLLSELLVKSRRQGGHAARRSYDVLMAYSGGKDSTYTLLLLKQKYRLRILAVTVDNTFLSETARRNIRTVCDRLDIDQLFFRPRWTILKKVFTAAAEQELYAKKALERASTICTSCMGIVKSLCLKLALESDIPMVGYGWSPGQAPLAAALLKTNPAFVKTVQQTILKTLREIAGSGVEAYFLNEKQYADAEAFPYNIHPMAWEHYDEAEIRREISAYGWIPPSDTDSNSTNCILNAFANDIHIRKYGFHPYAWEIANMVRAGVMTREEGLKRILAEQPAEIIASVKDALFAAEAPRKDNPVRN